MALFCWLIAGVAMLKFIFQGILLPAMRKFETRSLQVILGGADSGRHLRRHAFFQSAGRRILPHCFDASGLYVPLGGNVCDCAPHIRKHLGERQLTFPFQFYRSPAPHNGRRGLAGSGNDRDHNHTLRFGRRLPHGIASKIKQNHA